MENEINELNKLVANRIQEERKRQKLSQMELAVSAKVSQGYLAMIEANRKIPTITTIFKISRALNIKPSVLFEPEDGNKMNVKKQIIDLIQREL